MFKKVVFTFLILTGLFGFYIFAGVGPALAQENEVERRPEAASTVDPVKRLLEKKQQREQEQAQKEAKEAPVVNPLESFIEEQQRAKEQAQEAFFDRELDILEIEQDLESSVVAAKAFTELMDDMIFLLTINSMQQGECDEAVDIEANSKKGDSRSQWMLANLYLSGLCFSEDKKKYIEYLKMSAEKGYAKSMMPLAAEYLQGTNIPKNIEKALEWYKKAAEKKQL